MAGSGEIISAIVVRLLGEARQYEGLTMEELADRADVHRTYIGLLERGERQPTIDVAFRIADALGVRLSNLLQEAENEVSSVASLGDVQPNVEVIQSPRQRVVSRSDFRQSGIARLHERTRLDEKAVALAIESTYHTVDLIDEQLIGKGSPPISQLIELANLSSMIGNLLASGLAIASNGVYIRNRPHTYPDLLAEDKNVPDMELKTALETNKPKGHLAKAGFYMTFRYTLVDRQGVYTRGKDNRGEMPAIWEVKSGMLSVDDFDISNTVGDSGKTAVIKTAAFAAMDLIYYAPQLDPYSRPRYVG